MSQVPIQRTPIAMSTFAGAILKAWRAAFGVLPTKPQAGVLWAQYMIETGGSACWCWNIGNVKVTQAQVDAGVPWFDLPGTFEYIGGKRVVLPEGDPGRRFRAFPSLEEAMPWHMSFLRGRYAACWPAVEAGDVMQFAHLLKAGHDGKEGTFDDYFTAKAEDYGRGMMWHFRQWLSSTTYENARDGIEMLQDAPTLPELPKDEQPSRRPPVVSDFAIVRPAVPLRGDPDPDNDPEAA